MQVDRDKHQPPPGQRKAPQGMAGARLSTAGSGFQSQDIVRYRECNDRRSRLAIPLSSSMSTNFQIQSSDGLEARFCEAMDAAPVMIWVSGTEKECVWFNRPWL